MNKDAQKTRKLDAKLRPALCAWPWPQFDAGCG